MPESNPTMPADCSEIRKMTLAALLYYALIELTMLVPARSVPGAVS